MGVPDHLTLGITIAGMEEWLNSLPSDALDQVNSTIEIDEETNKPKFPPNDCINGYVNQWHIIAAGKGEGKDDNLSHCERLAKHGSPEVGTADVFVSWFLGTPVETLLDALRRFIRDHQELSEDTKFWVCDFVIRQKDVKSDLDHLGSCVEMIQRTVLLLDPLGCTHTS